MYFVSANQFQDRFEGAVAVQMLEGPVDPRYAEMEPGEKAFFELKRLTKIGCWHFADYESDAMWKLYAAQHKGVAICSTPERMRRAFKPFRLQPDYGEEDLWGGSVRYVDLAAIRMRGVGSLLDGALDHELLTVTELQFDEIAAAFSQFWQSFPEQLYLTVS